jgi:hypothetical protein
MKVTTRAFWPVRVGLRVGVVFKVAYFICECGLARVRPAHYDPIMTPLKNGDRPNIMPASCPLITHLPFAHSHWKSQASLVNVSSSIGWPNLKSVRRASHYFVEQASKQASNKQANLLGDDVYALFVALMGRFA